MVVVVHVMVCVVACFWTLAFLNVGEGGMAPAELSPASFPRGANAGRKLSLRVLAPLQEIRAAGEGARKPLRMRKLDPSSHTSGSSFFDLAFSARFRLDVS